MAKQFDRISDDHRAFIERQHIFFVGSAAASGRVNLSPKGLDAFRVLDERRVCYLDRTGSGNETAAHLRQIPRLTIMFCAFDGAPLILRLYGVGASLPLGSTSFESMMVEQFPQADRLGVRQIVTLDVDLVQTSCGFAVPRYSYEGERDTLQRWAEAKGEDGLIAYRREKNSVSIDGFPAE
jgi:hypothetical protein